MAAPVAQDAVLRQCLGASAVRRGNVWLVRLSGTLEEMGRQHGTLLREEALQGNVPFFTGLVRRMLGEETTLPRKRIEKWSPRVLKGRVLPALLFRKLLKNVPDPIRQEMGGLAEGLGIDPGNVLASTVVPDLLLWLLGKGFARPQRLLDWSRFSACTSVAVWGPATRDGGFVVGRNLDFFGSGVWDRSHAVFCWQPKSGQRWVSVGSAGVGTGAITAMNESGLTVAIHINRTKDVALTGEPMLALADRLIREATSMEDACRMARGATPTVGFSVFVTSAREGEAACFECSHSGVSVRRSRDWRPNGSPRWSGSAFWQTNHYLTPERQRDEIDVNVSIRAHTLGRYRAVERLIERDYGLADAQRVAEWMADHDDPFVGRTRPIGSIVTQPDCISSVVFEPLKRTVWVADGEAPVSHGRYVRFQMDEDLGAANGEIVALSPPPWTRTKEFGAYKNYEKAYAGSVLGYPPGELLAHVERAIEIDPRECIYAFTAGLLRLKRGNLKGALEMFERALALPDLPHKHASIRFWTAVTLDALSRRAEAVPLYEQVARDEGAGKDLRGWARRYAKVRFPVKDLRSLRVDFQFGDVILTPPPGVL